MKTFFDSSAFAKRYILETGSEEIDKLCKNASELAISLICIPEMISVFARLKREKKLSARQFHSCKKAFKNDITDADICLLSQPIIEISLRVIEKNVVRAMDAIHIACALDWQAELFVTADRRQLLAAKKMGLNIKIT